MVVFIDQVLKLFELTGVDFASIMHCTSFFRKLILTGCRLVKQTVKVKSMDLEQGLKSLVTAMY